MMEEFQKQVISSMSEMKSMLEANQKSLGILFRTIEGNGQPGLKQRFAVLESEHTRCMQEKRDSANLKPTKSGNHIQWVVVCLMVVSQISTIAIVLLNK